MSKIKFLLLGSLLGALSLLSVNNTSAQCGGLGKQDPIMSSYHGTIATLASGGFELWGENMNGDGISDILSPTQLVNGTNNFNFTGTPLLATLASHDQNNNNNFLLTTTGLYIWGTASVTVSPSVFPGGAMATLSLPSGVVPSDIRMMDACNGLLLVTYSGAVWVRGLNQIVGGVAANLPQAYGDGSANVDDNWHKVMTSVGIPLTNVADARFSGSQIFMVTITNKFYTCGPNVYLGDGSSAQSLSYATLMTSPPWVAGVTTKQIDVTCGQAVGGKINYFVLGSDGTIYALGDNRGGSLGIGNAANTASKTWQTIALANIAWISANNHDPKFAAVGAITASGTLYTWGTNDTYMLSQTIPSGTSSTILTPTVPQGFAVGTDIAKSLEIGGHTSVYVKVGSDRYCYAGHHINGSMGNGVDDDLAQQTYDCSLTGPLPAICGATATDYGDAPISYDAISPAYDYYATAYNNNPSMYLCLGATLPSNESAPKSVISGATCNSPCGDGVEEEGVSTFPAVAGGTTRNIPSYTVNVKVHNTIGTNAILGGWIDWNGNGTYEASEGATASVPDGSTGTVALTWTSQTLDGAIGRTGTYARFRITTAADGLTTSDFGGAKSFGEVEDYYVPFNTPLPVTFKSFTATGKNCEILINWETLQESNSGYYAVETSADGKNFLEVGQVISKNIITGSNYSYLFAHPLPGNNFFRLRAVDFDGKSYYSDVISVFSTCAAPNTLLVAPNPAKNTVTVSGTYAIENITVIDAVGKQCMVLKGTGTSQSIDLMGLVKGVYILQVKSGDNKTANVRLVKD